MYVCLYVCMFICMYDVYVRIVIRDFKFGLMPKVSSELQASVTFELLTHDERLFKLWTSTLSTVIS